MKKKPFYFEDEFCEKATEAQKRLSLIIGKQVGHVFELMGWYERDTAILCMVPQCEEDYRTKPMPFNDFFEAIKPWCVGDFYEGTVDIVKRGQVFCLKVKTKHKQP